MKRISTYAAASLLAAGMAGMAAPAHATNGYFSNGWGGVAKGMAGAGLTIGETPLDMAQNPAVGQMMGNVAAGCVTLFMPHRDVTIGANNGLRMDPLSTGKFESKNDLFGIPCGGVNLKVNDNTTLGFITYANGGMDTNYKVPLFGGNFGMSTTPTAVDMGQQFFAANLSVKLGDGFTIGVAPTLVIQRFKASGLEMFTGLSQDPGSVTGNGYSYSVGGGVKLGVLWEMNSWLSGGAAFQSPMYTTNFGKYSGLFAGSGSFDIPASLALGLNFKPAKGVSILLEYQRIFYSMINSIADSGNPPFLGPLGSQNGPGFGWNDANVIRLGVEWQTTQSLTLRGGVSYGNNPIPSSQVMLNILAPAVIQTHLSVGASYKITPKWSVTGAYTHAFSNTLSGNAPMAFGGQPISLRMDQDEVTMGVAYHF